MTNLIWLVGTLVVCVVLPLSVVAYKEVKQGIKL